MADIKEINGVYGGVELGTIGGVGDSEESGYIAGGSEKNLAATGANLPVKVGFWSKFKSFWLQDIDWKREIKVELTPYQQKVEDEINEFLHQEITWEKVHDFLFQEVTFGKKKA